LKPTDGVAIDTSIVASNPRVVIPTEARFVRSGGIVACFQHIAKCVRSP